MSAGRDRVLEGVDASRRFAWANVYALRDEVAQLRAQRDAFDNEAAVLSAALFHVLSAVRRAELRGENRARVYLTVDGVLDETIEYQRQQHQAIRRVWRAILSLERLLADEAVGS